MKYCYRITFLCILLISCFSAFGQIPAPHLYCIKGDTARWDLPAVGCGPVQAYELYYSQNYNGPYVLLTTITDLSQTEFVFTNSPGGVIYYYMQTVAACPGQSPLSSDTLDSASPLPVNIQVVSVLNDEVTLSWLQGLSPETNAYIIYKGLGGGAVQALDTVMTLSFTDTNKSTSDSVYTYYITALDRCGGTSVFSEPHSTILLAGMVDTCTQSIHLSFTPYVGWAGQTNYTLLLSKNGGPEAVAQNTTGNAFVIENIEDDTEYCFRVEAQEAGQNRLSYSNQYCLHSKKNKTITSLCLTEFLTPAFDLILDSVYLTLHTNDEIPVTNLFLQQADDISSLDNAPESPLSLSGKNRAYSPFDLQEVRYMRLISVDACGNRVVSNTINNLVILAKLTPDNLVNLSWNEAEWENATVRGYRLERISLSGVTELVSQGDAGFTAYTDRLIEGQDVDTRYCYIVTADLELNCGGRQFDTNVRSNIACVEKTAGAYMANAFIVGGVNPEFMPVFYFKESMTEYQMIIYDRYGGKVFETKDADKGWDGNKNGQSLPNGVYSYYVRIRSGNGSEQELRGGVTLIR